MKGRRIDLSIRDNFDVLRAGCRPLSACLSQQLTYARRTLNEGLLRLFIGFDFVDRRTQKTAPPPPYVDGRTGFELLFASGELHLDVTLRVLHADGLLFGNGCLMPLAQENVQIDI
jgi:hypothetical protein